ncbi:early nodulin-like protein 1 [Nymphaea colorata]|nr:early nodulin-like protein 1 [Nymphaea colorata]
MDKDTAKFGLSRDLPPSTMAFFADPNLKISWIFYLLFLQATAFCYQFKVGDLDSWGMPASVSPKIYENWPQKKEFRIGDSLLFLYPPSEDSVVQVTEDAYNICNTSNPIAYFDDGNTVFNITGPGTFYFTSGVNGHCLKLQKLAVYVASNGTSSSYSAESPSSLPQNSSSYPAVFGPTGSTSLAAPAMVAVSPYLIASFLFSLHILYWV